MENKSKLNTILLGIIIIILIVVLGYFFLNNSKQKENNLSQNIENGIVNNNTNETELLSYITPCEIFSISKKSFSFNYPEGYSIKEIKPLEGDVPLSGVMEITIQPKDGSDPIIIGPSFEICDTSGGGLCKSTGDGYRIFSNSNSSEISSTFNKIVSTIKTVSDCKKSDKETNNITWLKSPKFGLYYQDTLNIIEYNADKYGAQVSDGKGVATFSGFWGKDQDAGLTWGGNYTETNPNGGSSCMDDDDFGVFKYGVSNVTCLKGLVARVHRTSARNSITAEDLKIFGDFILKNRE